MDFDVLSEENQKSSQMCLLLTEEKDRLLGTPTPISLWSFFVGVCCLFLHVAVCVTHVLVLCTEEQQESRQVIQELEEQVEQLQSAAALTVGSEEVAQQV